MGPQVCTLRTNCSPFYKPSLLFAVILVFFSLGHSDWVMRKSQSSFIFIPLMAKEVEGFKSVSQPFVFHLLRTLFSSRCHFKTVVFLTFTLLSSLYIVNTEYLCHCIIHKIFFIQLSMCLFVQLIFYYSEAFQIHEVSYINCCF